MCSLLMCFLIVLSPLMRLSIAGGCTSEQGERYSECGTYIGCYPHECLHLDYDVNDEGNWTSLDSCMSSCKDSGYWLAAIYNKTKCSCASKLTCFNKPLRDDKCGLPCKSNIYQFCGSYIAVSLYKVHFPSVQNTSYNSTVSLLGADSTNDSTSASPSATNTTNEYETEISEMSTKVSSTAGKAEIPNSVISTDTRFPTSSPTSPENTRQSTATDMTPPSRVSFVVVTSSLGATIMVLVLILIITCVRYKRKIRRLKWQNQLAQQMVKLTHEDSAPYHTLNSSSRLHDNKSEVKEKTASAVVSGALTSTPSQDRSPRRTCSRAESADSVVDVDNDDDSDSDSDHGYIDMRSVLGRVSAKRDNNEGDGGDYVNFPFKPK